MNNFSSPPNVPENAQQPTRATVQLRYCHYLRLMDAKRLNKHPSKTGFFEVPTITCWVVVTPQDLGFRWCAVLPLLDDAQATIERQKGLEANLAKVTPSITNSPSWVLDIPERYPEKLLSDAKPEHGENRRDCKVVLREPAQTNSKESNHGAQLRYCYYLHLDDGKKGAESTEKSPVFRIPYKCRWVLVRKYLRDGTAQIYQLTSDNETDGGVEKPLHVRLGKIVPKHRDFKRQIDSWAQCVLERYPEHLMRDAETDFKKTKHKLDVMETTNFLKIIQAGSPDHWLTAK